VSINLEEIVERAVPLSQGHYLAVRVEDFNALVAEVERLRELLLNAGWPREADGIAELALQAERAAVVAWLRAEAEAEARAYTGKAWVVASRVDNMADAIERGEHRREEES